MSERDKTPARPSDADTNRRAELVDKWIVSGLDEAESAELRILEEAADRYLDAISPIPLESLEWLEKRVAELKASEAAARPPLRNTVTSDTDPHGPAAEPGEWEAG